MRSLSPKRISSSAMASFSLTTGTTPELEQAQQRAAGVEVLAAVDEVERGQQHLAAHQAVAAERVVVDPHEPALADRRQRLQGDGVVGAVSPPQARARAARRRWRPR